MLRIGSFYVFFNVFSGCIFGVEVVRWDEGVGFDNNLEFLELFWKFYLIF